MAFKSELCMSTRPGGLRFVLDCDLVYEGKYQIFTIPAGFVTDLATVPAACTWLAPRYGLYTRAAVLHDFLCEEAHHGWFSRADADGIFRRVMREEGVSHPRRWMMWGAVRAGGRFADGMDDTDQARFLLVVLLAIPFAAIPTIAVQLWLWLFRAVEWITRRW